MNQTPNIEQRSRGASPLGLIAMVLLFVLLLIVANVGRVSAQALHPDVQLTRPTGQSGNRLEVLRSSQAQIALYNGVNSAPQASSTAQQTVRDAVHFWELLLLGLNVPYTTLNEHDLSRSIGGNIRILILPSAEVLSDRQQRVLLRFVENEGGGIIASGLPGFIDERGRPRGDVFFRELFGAEMVLSLPEEASGLLHSLGGGNPLTDGLPPGFRLNLSAQVPMAAARPTSSGRVGRPYTYTPPPSDDPFDDVSFVLYNRLGRGRSVWYRFNPQDVSREAHQQQVYQALVVNSLAYAANVPSVAVRPWPESYLSATVFAGLPEVGRPTDFSESAGRVLDALSSSSGRASFFLTSAEASTYPTVVERIAQSGEVAISSDTDDLLKNQPIEVQQRRLNDALADLRPFSSGSIMGFYPPGGFYDVSTVRAMHSAGLEYMLLPSAGESEGAHPLRWYGDADYREPLALNDDAMSAAALATTQPRRITRNELVAFPLTGRDDYTVVSLLGLGGDPSGQLRAYQEDFMRVHGSRGLYVLPFHLGIQGRTIERANVLGQVAELAARQGSWMTTFRELYAWYRQHENLSLQIVDMGDRSMTFDVVNAGTSTVSRVSIDVRIPQSARAANATGNVKVAISSDGETLTLTLPSARPGSNRFTLSYDTR